MEFTMENAYLKVTVTDWGAQIKSVVRKCDGVEHIWRADPQVWGYHSPILFPYCGRLKDDRFELNGQTYEKCAKHGFVRNATFYPVQHSAEKLVLELTESPETLAVFPFKFRLQSIFVLEKDALCHTLQVDNTDGAAFSFGIGFHPAFAVPFDEGHTYDDYELRFSQMESPLCLNTLPKGLIDGKAYSLGSNMDTIPVTAELFDNDCHCMVNLQSQTLGLYEKDTGRGVVCNIESFPYCLIWSKPGAPQFICIEPWNSLPSYEFGGYAWEEKPAAARLAPGERWSTTMRTAFVR